MCGEGRGGRRGRRNGKEVRKIRRKEGKKWKEREENEEEGKGSEEDRQRKLTSLQSGDICTDSPPTGISVLGRHSVLTTHKHHILCEWSETCDHTLSHVDSTIYGHRL